MQIESPDAPHGPAAVTVSGEYLRRTPSGAESWLSSEEGVGKREGGRWSYDVSKKGYDVFVLSLFPPAFCPWELKSKNLLTVHGSGRVWLHRFYGVREKVSVLSPFKVFFLSLSPPPPTFAAWVRAGIAHENIVRSFVKIKGAAASTKILRCFCVFFRNKGSCVLFVLLFTLRVRGQPDAVTFLKNRRLLVSFKTVTAHNVFINMHSPNHLGTDRFHVQPTISAMVFCSFVKLIQ